MGLIINPRQIIKDGITSLRDVWSSSKVSAELSGKQATLVSGTNIKTINNTSLLGSGDITISGGRDIPKINMIATTATLDPNKFYVWGEVASLDISLAAETADIENVYKFQFQSGATATTLTLPNNVVWYGATPSRNHMTYIISVESSIAKIERYYYKSPLPLEFQQVEYLEGDGLSYIDISASLNTASITYMEVTFKDVDGLYDAIIGLWLNNRGNGFCVARDNTNIRWWIGSAIKSHTWQSTTDWTTVIYENNNWSMNQVIMDTSYIPTSYNIGDFRIFGRSGYGGGSVMKGKISYFRLVESNNSITLLPCYRISDNVAGLYYLEQHSFLTNAGTGSFIVGPDV